MFHYVWKYRFHNQTVPTNHIAEERASNLGSAAYKHIASIAPGIFYRTFYKLSYARPKE